MLLEQLLAGALLLAPPSLVPPASAATLPSAVVVADGRRVEADYTRSLSEINGLDVWADIPTYEKSSNQALTYKSYAGAKVKTDAADDVNDAAVKAAEEQFQAELDDGNKAHDGPSVRDAKVPPRHGSCEMQTLRGML